MDVKLPDFITAENELDGQEAVYIAQGGKTRKTLLQKIKDFIIGTESMGTTAGDVTGAISEIKKIVDSNTDLLNDKVDKSKIINNCNTTEEGFILDARQGTSIVSMINTILDDARCKNGGDLNDIKEETCRMFVFNASNSPNDRTFGFFISLYFDGADGGFVYGAYTLHLFFDWEEGILYTRTYSNQKDSWSTWLRHSTVKKEIKDVAETTVNLDNGGSYTYTVLNGFCTVEFKNIPGSGINLTFVEKSQLPIPVLSQPCRLENDGSTVGTIYISGDNSKLTGHKISSKVGFGTIQYQVDIRKY